MNHINTNNPITEFVDQILNRSVSEVVKKDFISTKPNVNIIKLEDKYVIQVAVPGVNKSDFTIDLDNDKLIISIDNEDNDQDNIKYTRKEFSFNKFKRSFIIPSQIDKGSIKASYKLGILELTLIRLETKKEEAINIEIK